MVQRTNRPLWLLAALLFVAIAAVAWIKVGPQLTPRVVEIARVKDDCELRQGPCEAVFQDGSRIAFEISPRRIPTLSPLALAVRTVGVDARQVEVDFAGVDMNMGFNRVTLNAVQPGDFAGTGMLPVCVRARMTWEAKVLLHTTSGLMAAHFRFDTYLPNRGPAPRIGGANAE